MLKAHQLPRFVLVMVVAVAAPVANSRGAEKILRWKLQPGETLQYQMVQEMNQKLFTGNGAAPMAITGAQTMDMTWKVESVDEQGVASLTQTITRIQMKMQSPQGVMLEYDSASGKEAEGMAKMLTPMYEAMVNRPIRAKFTRTGEIRELILPPGMVEGMNKVAGGGQMGTVFSEDWIKQAGEIGVLPESPVTSGQTWIRRVTMKNPATGPVDVESTFRYEGPEVRDGKTLEKISVSMQFKFRGEKQEGTVGIKEQSGKAILYFDSDAGRVRESVTDVKMKMDINVLGRAMSQDMDMNSVAKLK